MKITPEEVRRVARLARLHLDEASVARHAQHLERILEHMQTLSRVTLAELPSTLPQPGSSLRADIVTPRAVNFDGLAQAPAREGDYFVVPRIIEG